MLIPSRVRLSHVPCAIDKGTILEAKCDEGYVPKLGSVSVTCGDDGQWDGQLATCEGIYICIHE